MKIKAYLFETIAFLSMILAILAYFYMQSSESKISELQQSAQDLNLKINNLKRQIAPKTEQQQKKTNDTEINAIPAKEDTSEFLTQLHDMSDQVDIQIQQLSFDMPVTQDTSKSTINNATSQNNANGTSSSVIKKEIIGNPNFSVSPSIQVESGKISVKGTSEQVNTFIQRLQKLPRFVTISNLTKQKDDKNDDSITVNLDFQIYFLPQTNTK
jgi:Tfp pilus assembly protein PilO